MSREFLKKHVILIFIILSAFQSIFNNLVHPVTPSFIHHLQLNDYMFGVAYASMNIAMFISSFYWADASNKMKMSHIMVISLCGYALAQFIFMSAQSEFQIVLARLLAGTFSGGFLVGQMNFLVSQSKVDQRGKNLTNYSIAMIVASTIGYLIGGLAGDINLTLPFKLQVIAMIVLAIINYFFLNVTQKEVMVTKADKISPVTSMKYSWKHLSVAGRLLFISIFFAWMANIIFDNSFNYYIRDVLNYPPSMNGILKAIIGGFTLVSNLSLTYYLIKKTKISNSMRMITLFVTILVFMILINTHQQLFIILSLFVLGAFSIIQPLQQTSVTLLSKDQETVNHLMGFFNATKSLAAIFGALAAGFIYGVHPRGPFVLALIAVFIAFIILSIHERKTR